MTRYAFALFDTAIGRCAIVWAEHGIAGVQLPEASEPDTRRRTLERFPDASEVEPPPDVRRAQDGIVALLAGEPVDLSEIALDMAAVPAFHRRVYEAARAIPPGATLTYGQIAENIEAPRAARAVGQALGRNPFALLVPCHRVLGAGGGLGGFSAHGGVATKRKLLEIEGSRTGTSSLFANADPRPRSRAPASPKTRANSARVPASG